MSEDRILPVQNFGRVDVSTQGRGLVGNIGVRWTVGLCGLRRLILFHDSTLQFSEE